LQDVGGRFFAVHDLLELDKRFRESTYCSNIALWRALDVKGEATDALKCDLSASLAVGQRRAVVGVLFPRPSELRPAFESFSALGWNALGFNDAEGPHVFIEGVFQGHEVYLQVLVQAPEDEEPALKVDTTKRPRRRE